MDDRLRAAVFRMLLILPVFVTSLHSKLTSDIASLYFCVRPSVFMYNTCPVCPLPTCLVLFYFILCWLNRKKELRQEALNKLD